MDIRNNVQKAIGGDIQAMEFLYKSTYQKLRAVTVSILKNEDDAEDIIQESYIKAFSNLHQLEDAEKFEGWLCRIASNKCKDYLKKHKPILFSDLNKTDDEDEDPFEWSIEDDSADYNPEEVAISDDTRRQLMDLVNSLPDEQRICLVYYAVEEMKISEIAELLEVPEATVKSRLKYAKDKMKNKIEDLEKKGVKIRGLSGLAIIPFLQYIFAIEAKAATLGSFTVIAEAVGTAISTTGTTTAANVIAEGAKTVITEGAKQAGTKAAAGIGAKIASMSLVTKIAAGVVATGIAVTIPFIIKDMATNKDSSNGDFVSTGYYVLEDVFGKTIKDDNRMPKSSKIVECDYCGEKRRGESRYNYLFEEEVSMCYVCMDEISEMLSDEDIAILSEMNEELYEEYMRGN